MVSSVVTLCSQKVGRQKSLIQFKQMNCSFYQVDVFTKIPFGGNPLAVVFDTGGLTSQNMQNIAREMNLSETSFVLPPDNLPADFSVRIFTPEKELPFAGHPTIGTAHILRETGKVFSGNYKIKLAMNVGVVTVSELRRENLLFMDQLLPVFHPPLDCSEELGKALGLSTKDINSTSKPIQIVSTGLPVLIVPITSLQALKGILVDTKRLNHLLTRLGIDLICVYTCETFDPTATIHSRVFAPKLGIPEDPATGSAAGATGAYLSINNCLSKDDCENICIEQGHIMGRPSDLFVCVEKNKNVIESVRVGGESVTIIKGNIKT